MADGEQSKEGYVLEFTAFSSKKSDRESPNSSKRRRYVETVKYKRRFKTKRMNKLVKKMSQSHCDINMKEWQLRQQIAYWKSHAISLEYENKLLHEQIRQMFGGMNRCSERLPYNDDRTRNVSVHGHSRHGRDTVFKRTAGRAQERADDDDESVEFEVNEDWIKFMELSAKHKAELKKQRELERESTDDDAVAESKRISDTAVAEATMEALYGEDYRKILAYETAMRISYDDNVRKTKPSYWPNIPLRL